MAAILVAALALVWVPVPAAAAVATRVTAFNLLCPLCTVAYGRWQERLPALADTVLRNAPHVVALQENISDVDVAALLALLPGYDAVYANGTYRGYALNYPDAALLYDTAALRVRACGWYWLSPTPDTPSRGWSGTGIPRLAVWARFADLRAGGRDLIVLSTHFDPNSANHVPSARLLLERAAGWWADGDAAIVAAGDFNTEDGTEAYRILTEGAGGGPGTPLAFNNTYALAAAPRLDRNSSLPDNYACVDYRPSFPACMIDHVLVAAPPAVPVTVTDWVADMRQFTDGSPYFPSDHRAYTATLVY
jgi:endonuclease/exonuclease/phosphatase family metal-dependent hydrolase